jgi:uncharacterized membrane protein YdcZ (DUF606 family)
MGSLLSLAWVYLFARIEFDSEYLFCCKLKTRLVAPWYIWLGGFLGAIFVGYITG